MENRKKNFSEWYNEIVETAELSDKRYHVKGMNVWRPYGLKIMQGIDGIIRRLVDSRDFDEVSFPVPVTKDQLMVEFEHVKGFEGELYWITRGGHENLDVELALRPTSEAAMYPMFSLWIRSHADLPMKLYQIVSVYRHETKHTRSFIRIREIHFFEAHTAHATYEDAEKQMVQYKEIWERLADELCLPYITNRRPDWDKFPGARYTLAFDTLLPSSRSLQIGTIHQYGTNFSENYDIKYADDDGEHHFVSQTTFGMSERLLAAVIGVHGDDKGLILSPGIAPVQVIIVPIPSESEDTIGYSRKIGDDLLKMGFRVRVDDRDNYTPGYKYNDWEMRGVPVRVEIGAREVGSGNVTVALRSKKGKKVMSRGDFVSGVTGLLGEVKASMKESADKLFLSLLTDSSSLDDMKKAIGATAAYWCGSKECADHIEAEADLDPLGFVNGTEDVGKCIVCGTDGKKSVFSKSY